MRNRTPISLFPFLSVLICTMGVLSFLAVTFQILGRAPAAAAPRREKPIDVRWIGAPPHVRPLLVECREGGAFVHLASGGPPRFFSRQTLEREVTIVKELQAQGVAQFGADTSRQALWLYFKAVLENERQLRDSFTLSLHRMEVSNLAGENFRLRVQRYPLLLVYPQGVESYDLVSYLLESTTRLASGVEPLLPGWSLPYQKRQS
jgi:hypothetical protein